MTQQDRMSELYTAYRGKRFHILGIGRSGVGAANLLRRLGGAVSISDKEDNEIVKNNLRELSEGVKVFAGRQDIQLLSGIDSLVLSPGVPMSEEITREASKRSIEVMGEVELSYRVMRQVSDLYGMKVNWLGITGTNGKSTTTTLLYEMLKEDGRDCILAGNIGIPISGEILKFSDKVHNEDLRPEKIDIVLELSSFQLESMKEFKLDVSTILNITDDHLDRYRDLAHYAEAKAGIFINQESGDISIINADDENTVRISDRCRAQRYFVSTSRKTRGGYVDSGTVFMRTDDEPLAVAKVSDIKIVGIHNLYNALTASLMAYLSGVSINSISSVLKEFPGLEHRLEFVGESQGVKFYNDSKGTNIGAVMKSLQSFQKGVILIAGGRDKNSDFSQLVPYMKNRVKKAVLIGEAAEKIKNAIGHTVDVEKALSLRDAVERAQNVSDHGDTILLSPACASFDMFRNYEERGKRYKEFVLDVITREKRNE